MANNDNMFDFDDDELEVEDQVGNNVSANTVSSKRVQQRSDYVEENDSVSINETLQSDFAIKWQKEIDLHRIIDTAIIIEGNVNDEQVYSKEGGVVISSVENYLYEYLHSIGYKTVIFFNHVEGFYNRKSKSEYKRFFSIAKKADIQEDGASEERDISDSDDSQFGKALRDIRAAMNNKEEPVAIVLCDVSRYISSPNTISDSDQFFYSKLSFATKSKRTFKSGLHNIMFLVAEKANDIPVWFYLNNPRVKTVTIPIPDMNIRRLYIDGYYDDFDFVAEETDEEIEKNKETFVNYTEGFKLVDLESLRVLMNKEKLPVSCVSQGVSKFKYGVDKNPWEDQTLRDSLDTLEESLKKRVKGQDAAVHKAAAIIKSAVLGISGLQHSSSKSKPRGVMFLAGPTGVGKTELAKAISEWVFKSDKHVIRFDMSEYSQAHTDQRLLGAPPGYVGYEQGGQLTEAVKREPFSVILFDEIEKAHPSILDKFLQILEDGRMTDGKGETVYFSDSLIIFTSNLGMFKEEKNQFGFVERKQTVRYGDDGCNEKDEEEATKKYNDYSSRILNSINEFFTTRIERPEIKNRIGENFIVFNYISFRSAGQIAEKQFNVIKTNLRIQKNISLDMTENARRVFAQEIRKEEHISQGGRGVGNVVENMIIRPLSDYLVENRIWENASITINNFVNTKGIWRLECDV